VNRPVAEPVFNPEPGPQSGRNHPGLEATFSAGATAIGSPRNGGRHPVFERKQQAHKKHTVTMPLSTPDSYP